ncbi:unnamed protein product [Spirodela intermedia]|uniref:Uncharacterized protein n=1 Tax=Spirodela intermedia TaxID=51605 RepID=A0A7I8L4V7_SPIIN|nr:unnamed protein product [Spirodela intermedia]
MSRCFPFPPPGYEKKPQSNNLDLLLKKKKEKEHKKEKKDREKKEGRERKERDRDKDRSKDKNREKKDKKEKRRDKERKKDKDKDEKGALFERKDEDRRTEGLHKAEEEGPLKTGDPRDASPKVEGVAGKGQRKLEGVGGSNGMERIGSAGANHERAIAFEVVRDLVSAEERRVDGAGRPGGKGGGAAIAEYRRAGPASALPERSLGSEAAQDPFGGEQRRLDGPGQPAGKKSSIATIAATTAAAAISDAPEQRRAMDGGTVQSIASDKKAVNDSDRKADGKKKTREKEASERKGDKDREKKHKGKDRTRDKEEKKREKTKVEGKNKRREEDKLRDGGNMGSSPAKPPAAAAAATAAAEKKSPAANGPHSKRDRNGFLFHEDEVRPHKLPRPDPSSQLSIVNGIKPESVHINFSKPMVNEEQQHKINGTVPVVAPVPIKPRPTTATAATTTTTTTTTTAAAAAAAEAPENGEPTQKPPHPHEIQLSRLLQLPKLEEWLEPDDQEWLLGREDLRQKPPEAVAPKPAAEQPKVWADAFRADPDGVVVLPYVVPY